MKWEFQFSVIAPLKAIKSIKWNFYKYKKTRILETARQKEWKFRVEKWTMMGEI